MSVQRGLSAKGFVYGNAEHVASIPWAAKAALICLLYGVTEQLAEKVLNMGEIGRKPTSGAEARIDSKGFTPGMNPRPTLKSSFFSQAVKPRPFNGST